MFTLLEPQPVCSYAMLYAEIFLNYAHPILNLDYSRAKGMKVSSNS